MERTNATIVNLNQWTEPAPWQDSYIMKVDCRRNCYNCEGFGYIIRNCRNWEMVGQGKRINYENNGQSNLNGEESLVVLNQALVVKIGLQCSLQ